MRITEGKIGKKDHVKLLEIAKRYGVSNLEFVLDLYAIYKYGGRKVLSDNAVTKRLKELQKKGKIDHYWMHKSGAAQSRLFLADFTTYEWFKRNRKLGALDAVEETLKMLGGAANVFYKIQQTMPAGAPSSNSTAIKTVDTLNYSDLFDWGLSLFKTLQVVGTGGDGSGDNPYGCSTQMTKQINAEILQAANNLQSRDLIIFKLAQVLKSKIGKGKGKQRVASQTPEKITVEQAGFEQAAKALSIEHADDALFEKRGAVKELGIKRYEKVVEKPQLLYILLDTSGSMRSSDGTWNRCDAATAFCLALLSKVVERGDQLALQFFSGGVGPLQWAKDRKSASMVAKYVRDCNYNGDATCLHDSILCAAGEIKQAKDELRGADLLVITDGDAPVDETVVKKALGSTKLHMLHIGQQANSQMVDTMKRLKTLGGKIVRTAFEQGMPTVVELGQSL